jgi:hypothetical protein
MCDSHEKQRNETIRGSLVLPQKENSMNHNRGLFLPLLREKERKRERESLVRWEWTGEASFTRPVGQGRAKSQWPHSSNRDFLHWFFVFVSIIESVSFLIFFLFFNISLLFLCFLYRISFLLFLFFLFFYFLFFIFYFLVLLLGFWILLVGQIIFSSSLLAGKPKKKKAKKNQKIVSRNTKLLYTAINKNKKD